MLLEAEMLDSWEAGSTSLVAVVVVVVVWRSAP